MNGLHLRERLPQLLSNACGLPEKLAHGRHQRTLRPDRPQTKIPQPSTPNQLSVHELLQRTLDGVRVGANPSGNLSRVELLPGSARE